MYDTIWETRKILDARDDAPQPHRLRGDASLLTGVLLFVTFMITAYVFQSGWLLLAGFLSSFAGTAGASLLWTQPFDAEKTAKRIIADWRTDPMSTPAENAGVVGEEQSPISSVSDILIADRFIAEMHAEHKRESRRSLMWQWAFFLLGIIVTLMVQLLHIHISF
jgi:hypothetical protein